MTTPPREVRPEEVERARRCKVLAGGGSCDPCARILIADAERRARASQASPVACEDCQLRADEGVETPCFNHRSAPAGPPASSGQEVRGALLDAALALDIIHNDHEAGGRALAAYKAAAPPPGEQGKAAAPAAAQEPEQGESLARRFHETYERLAPSFGYETRKDSAVPWEQVPERNRRLMIAVCREIAPAQAEPDALREGPPGRTCPVCHDEVTADNVKRHKLIKNLEGAGYVWLCSAQTRRALAPPATRKGEEKP